MKKNLKKRERGRIALLLFMVVALLVTVAVIVLTNIKTSKSENRLVPHSQRGTSGVLQNPAAIPPHTITKPESLLQVSYCSLFSFYYA